MWRPAIRWARRSNAVQQAEDDAGLPASITTQFQGSALAFQSALGNECC